VRFDRNTQEYLRFEERIDAEVTGHPQQ